MRETPMLVAHIDTTHGLRGEVSAVLCTDFPERFAQVESLRVGRQGSPESGRSIDLRGWRLHRGKVLLHFSGVEDIDAARDLVGSDVWVAPGEEVDLPKDTYFHHDLLGLEVRDRQGARIGKVEEIMGTAAADILVVASEGGEVLIPAVQSICVEVDLEKGVLVIDPPEGLLEANAR